MVLACMVTTAISAQSAEMQRQASTERSADWLQAHLEQVEDWSRRADAPVPATQQAEPALRELREQAQGLRARSRRPLEANPLLQGLSPALLEEGSVLAQEPARLRETLAQGVGLELLLALAAQRNPSLRAAQDQFQAAIEELDQAGYLQELLVRYRAFTRELDTRTGSAMQRPGIKRHFPSPAALTLKSEIAHARIEMARLNYQATLRQAINSMARTYFELRYIDSAVTVLLETRDLFRRMEQVALAQLRVAKANQTDALRSQALLDRLEADLENLREQRSSRQAQGNALLGLPVQTQWRLTGSTDLLDPQMSLQDALQRMEQGSQQLHGQEQRLRMLRAALRLAEFNLYPLAASAASRLDPGRGAEAGPTRSAAAAFPIRSNPSHQAATYGTQGAYLQELRFGVQAQEDRLAAVRASLQAEAEEARRMASQARRSHLTFDELVVPKSLRAFNSMRGRYNTADVPFIEYLDAGRAYLEASLESEKARRDHNLALTDLMGRLGLSAAQLLGQTPETQQQGQGPHP